jgi:hypothetical protein
MSDQPIDGLEMSVEEFDKALKQLQDDQSELSRMIDEQLAELYRELLACLEPSPKADL